MKTFLEPLTPAEERVWIEKIEKGKLEVFSGPFTGVSVFDRNDKINLNTPYKENANSSSPSFSYVLDDVITIEKMKEE